MRDSWIKRAYKSAKRRLHNNYLIQILLVSLIAEKKEPRRLQKQNPEVLHLTKRDLLLILCVIAFLMFTIYITYKTGALESTRYYQIK